MNNTSANIETVNGVGINNGVVHQTIGISEAFHAQLIAPYQKEIQRLEQELSGRLSPQEHQRLNSELIDCKQQLANKEQEILELNKWITQSDGETVKKATQILNNQGLTAALAYLKNLRNSPHEQQVKTCMLELADKYQFEASLLQLDNQYAEAQTAYESMLTYDRGAERLFTYAHYLQKQNNFSSATTHYKEALGLYRTFAASNPSVYMADVATILNNLAVLYSDQNQMDDALAAYTEALALRRTLAASNPSVYMAHVATTLNNLANLYCAQNQMDDALAAYTEALALRRTLAASNPGVYGIDLANTLVMGVDLLGRPEADLMEAKTILLRFEQIPRAKKLLGFIDELSSTEV